MNPPKRLTDEDIHGIRLNPRFDGAWTVQSLLLTLEEERAEAEDRHELLELEAGSLKLALKWFEETYNTRAMSPLWKRRTKGAACPYCKRSGVSSIGDEHACFDCGARWQGSPENEPE